MKLAQLGRVGLNVSCGTLLLALVLTLSTAPVRADETVTPTPPDSGQVTLPNPLGNSVTPAELAGRIIKTLLGLSGAAALVVFV